MATIPTQRPYEILVSDGTFHIAGDVNESAADELDEMWAPMLERALRVRVDLGDVTRLDRAVLVPLSEAARRLRDSGGTFRITRTSRAALECLHAAGATELLGGADT